MKKYFLLTALMAFVISYRAQIPNYIPTTGLMGLWTFSNNANDVSGNSNNGTISGALSTTDRFSNPNSAYSFNGSSDYISTTMTGILGSNPRAVSFWAKSTQSVGTMCGVSWGYESPTAGIRYECAFNEGNQGAGIIGCNCAITYSTPVNIYDNNWHHYVYQYSSGTISQVQIYQDGVILSTKTYTHNPSTVLNTVNNWPVHFGRIPYSIPHYFSGSLDEIGIWNRVLTNCEIQELFSSAKTTISISSPTTVICSGQSVNLIASGVNTYSWSTSANTPSINVSPTVTTVYNVSGTNTATGCSAANSITITVNPCAGINELNTENENLSVYPNPNNGTFYIKSSTACEITLLNDLGQTLKKVRVKDSKEIIEIKNLAEGIYFVTCETNNAKWQKKIIVSK